MRTIHARKIVVMAVLFIRSPFATEADAGFEWIGSWQKQESGMSTFFSGSDKPDGVQHAGARIEGYFASSDSMLWPYPQSPEASIHLSRHFSLTGSPGGWQVDLEWKLLERKVWTIHTQFSGAGVINILPEPDFRDNLFSGGNRTLVLPDGDYWFEIDLAGNLSRPRPPYDLSPFAGTFQMQYEWSMRATAVPEPASMIVLGQGVAAMLVLVRISNRRKMPATQGRFTWLIRCGFGGP